MDPLCIPKINDRLFVLVGLRNITIKDNNDVIIIHIAPVNIKPWTSISRPIAIIIIPPDIRQKGSKNAANEPYEEDDDPLDAVTV